MPTALDASTALRPSLRSEWTAETMLTRCSCVCSLRDARLTGFVGSGFSGKLTPSYLPLSISALIACPSDTATAKPISSLSDAPNLTQLLIVSADVVVCIVCFLAFYAP